MNILELRNVNQLKGETHILRDLCLSFEEATLTTVLGQSGSGKSTLLRLLNGLDSPSSGELLFRGKEFHSYQPMELRQKIGLLLQQPVMFQGTVLDNVSFVPRLRARQNGGDEPEPASLEKNCRELLARVGLASFCHKEAALLSVGEKQRVALARALATRPEVLLMDEPSSALDRDSTRLVETLVQELLGEGMTLIVVTHNLAQARRLGGSALLLEEGMVKAKGPALEVFKSIHDEGLFGGCCHDGH